MAPRTRYAMVVTTAVVGAGAVAFGAGSALPAQQAADGATSALDKVSASAKRGSEAESSVEASSVREARTPVGRASRAQRRAGTPVPEELPQWVRPAQGPLSSVFGARWGTQHLGLDIAAAYGSTIRAAANGTVVQANVNGGYGNFVLIDHGNGTMTAYGHASKLLVEAGQKVEAGTPIALVGSTGFSTGAHLHFEVRRNGEKINPMPWMAARGVDMASSVDTSR
jgi:murein DD-endopeptidase MepM/ murein hydrolase activator NlpD